MTVIFEAGYTLPGADFPLTHARIAHGNNWLTGGTAAASTTNSAFFINGPLNSLTYERWKPTAVTATWEYDHGSSVTCDYCCIGAHTLGTNGNSVQVQYWTGSAWADLTAVTALSSDMPVMAIFEPQAAQRWRISISGGTVPEVGVVKFGEALQMQRPLYGGHTPLDFSRNTVMRSNRSVTGEFLGRTKLRSTLSTSFAWQHLTRTWIDANWKSFQLAIEEDPFFIAWRPGGFSEVGLCYTDESPIPSNMGIRDLMEVGLNVTARGYE
jgi:hypothetical protein